MCETENEQDGRGQAFPPPTACRPPPSRPSEAGLLSQTQLSAVGLEPCSTALGEQHGLWLHRSLWTTSLSGAENGDRQHRAGKKEEEES